MSNISVNTITDASGGSTASINGLTPQASNMQPFNRIINGAMTVDQRNAGASVTNGAGTTTYTLDRWALYGDQASKFTVQQSSTTATGFVNSLVATSLSAYTVGASEIFNMQQRIEGFNVADLGWGTATAATVTLSFWVRSSLTGTFGGSIMNSAENRNYPFNYTISVANTFEQKTITITGDTSGTWLTTNGLGIRVFFSIGTGATMSGTAGAWAAGNKYSATGATSVVGTSGATFYITGVQLEAGSTASSFAHEFVGDTLSKCQRYYEKVVFSGSGYFNGANGLGWMLPYKVSKRASPSVSLSGVDPNGWSFNLGNWNTGVTQDEVYLNITGNSTGFVRFGDTAIITSEL